MCPQFPKQPPRAGGWVPQDRTVGRRSSPPPPTTTSCHPPSKNQTPALGPASPSKSGDAAATFPYPLTPPIPYPTPMPTHTRPTIPIPRIHATIRRSCAGRGTSPFLPPNPPPSPSPQAKAAGRLRVQGLPCLVSLCRFRAIFHRGPRPPFGSRLGRYDLFPFVDFSDTLQRGRQAPDRPVPGKYDLSPFVDLSVAPQS